MEGTFQVEPSEDLTEFTAQLIDENATLRNLDSGTVSLNPSASGESMTVTFDTSYDSNAIRIEATGTVPIEHVAAP